MIIEKIAYLDESQVKRIEKLIEIFYEYGVNKLYGKNVLITKPEFIEIGNAYAYKQ